MRDALDERLSDVVEHFGARELAAFLDRRVPPDKATFIRRLYSDIHEAVEDLQGLAHQLADEGENKLRSRLLTILRTHGYRASGEADHRGHTDLLIENSHVRVKWIGEAKKHSRSGYDHLRKGMLQLHTRYTTGTDRDSGLIVFVFTRDAAGVVKAWKAASRILLCAVFADIRRTIRTYLFLSGRIISTRGADCPFARNTSLLHCTTGHKMPSCPG